MPRIQKLKSGTTSQTRGSSRAPFPANAVRAGKTYARYMERGAAVHTMLSVDGKRWRVVGQPLFGPRATHFDEGTLRILQPPVSVDEGVLLIYFVSSPLAFGAALFDKTDPTKLIARSERAFWSSEEALEPLRLEVTGGHLVLIFRNAQGEEIKTVVPLDHVLGTHKPVHHPRIRHEPQLKRHHGNPIITPQAHHDWENVATFNPAALNIDNKVHILYRAVGSDGISTVGYASSKDGVQIDERLPYPIYVPMSSFDRPTGDPGAERYPSFSGGGNGGCEDPRAVEIDGRIYMTYTAFDGRHPPGIALTSVATDDFLKRRFKWRKPSLISPPGEQHKNWVLFPKKIRGKYAVLHSISPQVRVDYFDDLDFDGKTYIKSVHSGHGMKDQWDDLPRGVGSPPVETPDGWLVLYHAMDSRDPNRYKVGALLLDHDDPAVILARSQGPVLEPDEVYENSGYKAGVVYACGAVTIGNTLYVYYGGADTVLCVATYPLDEFVQHLTHRIA